METGDCEGFYMSRAQAEQGIEKRKRDRMKNTTPAADLADERETAQAYTVSSSTYKPTIDALPDATRRACYEFGSLRNWQRLPDDAKTAIRREFARIKANGERIDRENTARSA